MDNVAEPAAPLAIPGVRPSTKTAPVVEDVEAAEVVQAAKPKKAAKSAPVVEDVEEPEVRKEAKKPVAAAKASLAEMVSDWDDE